MSPAPRSTSARSPPCSSTRSSTRLGEPRRGGPSTSTGTTSLPCGNRSTRSHAPIRRPPSRKLGRRLGSVNPAKPTECSRSRTTSGTTVSGGSIRLPRFSSRRPPLQNWPESPLIVPSIRSLRSSRRSRCRSAVGPICIDGRRWVCSVEWPRRSWVSRSPQSNTSSSTRVSRPPSGCSRPNSDSTPMRRPPSRVGCRSPVARSTTSSSKPRSRWSSACASGRGSGAWSPPSVGCSPSRASPCGERTPAFDARHPISSPTSKPRPMSRRSTRTRTVQG